MTFLFGMMAGCGLSILIGLILTSVSKSKSSYPKERDPADWWKDT